MVAGAQSLSCNGGSEYPIDIELVPDSVVTNAGRESVEYHAEINVHRGNGVGLAWQAEVIDDRGRVVVPNLAKGSAKAKKSDSVLTAGLRADLSDGFYVLRVRVAVAPADEPATLLEAHQYVSVSNGKWREMDDIQWRKDSNVRLAFFDDGSSAKGGR
jgi:hypothetical protein